MDVIFLDTLMIFPGALFKGDQARSETCAISY